MFLHPNGLARSVPLDREDRTPRRSRSDDYHRAPPRSERSSRPGRRESAARFTHREDYSRPVYREDYTRQERTRERPNERSKPRRNLSAIKDWMFLWRRKSWLVAGIGAALLLYVTANAVMQPRYRAVSQIMIGPVDLRVVDKAVVPRAETADANVIQVESETHVLTSDKVLRRVVEAEKLASDPEFGAGGNSVFGAIVARLRETVGLHSQPSAGDAELAALRQLQRSVTAKRTERTYVVDLIVETRDPFKSARLANAIATAYTEEQSAARTDAARRATDSLSSRLTELRDRVRNAEEQVERYKREHNIVGANGRLVDEQQLTDLNSQLTAAKAKTAEAKSRYEQILRLQKNGGDPGSTAEAVQSNTIGRLREQYATIARQEATLASELGPRHPWVIEAHAQARNAAQLVTDEIKRVAEANRSDYERALENEKSLAANLDALKRKATDTSLAFVKLRELEREVDAGRAVYEAFLVRSREVREQESLDTINVRVISDAQPPLDRSWPPRRWLMLLAAMIIGLTGAIGAAYLAELLSGFGGPSLSPRLSERAGRA